jgi:hypothetical protein
MSKFKVGDVCVIVGSWTNPHHNGMECTVTSAPYRFYDLDVYSTRLADGSVSSASESCLRLKRPPTQDDSEPRSDFTPCEDDFSEWLKTLKRERV